MEELTGLKYVVPGIVFYSVLLTWRPNLLVDNKYLGTIGFANLETENKCDIPDIVHCDILFPFKL
jgi:hypothetical protein